jgi:hypothetical protein
MRTNRSRHLIRAITGTAATSVIAVAMSFGTPASARPISQSVAYPARPAAISSFRNAVHDTPLSVTETGTSGRLSDCVFSLSSETLGNLAYLLSEYRYGPVKVAVKVVGWEAAAARGTLIPVNRCLPGGPR